eukprot:c26627_g1_i1.p4 GENE.c26627_g1_i1~~c26627_g1_i1.p4  ORF type:complete len:102 (+),score=18.54 c26627_g1_i1:123-428(+)
MAAAVRRVSFEIEGKVQGVFFRKYTKKQADLLSLTGWVQNTTKASRSVIGVLEGSDDDVDSMLEWLTHTGSPKSRIDRCHVRSDKMVAAAEFRSFEITGTD